MNALSFTIETAQNNKCRATITISQPYVESLYNHIVRSQQSRVVTQGFLKGDTPLAYVEVTFRNNIIEHLKELLFNYCVVNYLYDQLIAHHVSVAGEPSIQHITLDPKTGAIYIFDFIQTIPTIENEWKRLPFKAPTRKNYKDIDRQVEFFLEEEAKKETTASKTVTSGDWVHLELQIVDAEGAALLPAHIHHCWLRLGDDLIDQEAYNLLENKIVGDRFVTTNELLQEYFNNHFDIKYRILVTIRDRVPNSHFSVEQFKKQFKLKTQKETHNKLIEVFSFRNDISQRRETVEAILELLLARYPFTAPAHLVKKQSELLLRDLQSSPDYNVYRNQPDFKEKVHMLAEKLVKEQIIINHLAALEKLDTNDEDVINYLNLTKRPRTKQFIRFDIPQFKAQGHETPMPHDMIRYYALHEKMLNTIINTLISLNRR